MRVVITESAEDDLVGIWLWIAKDNPLNAERYVAKLRDQIASLERFPHKGRRRDDIIPGSRAIVFDSILIIYRIMDDVLEVLHVVDGRQDLPKHSFRS